MKIRMVGVDRLSLTRLNASLLGTLSLLSAFVFITIFLGYTPELKGAADNASVRVVASYHNDISPLCASWPT
jgi:hypothetical protein